MDHDRIAKLAIVFTFCAVLVMVFGGVLVKSLIGTPSDETVRQVSQDFNMILVALTGYLGGLASGKRP
jgi:hypothetical protein